MSTERLRVLFAGGGTAGHINPALTVADILKAEGAEVVFAGTSDGLEADLVPRAGYPLYTVQARPLPRRLGWQLVRAAGAAGLGLVQAVRLVRRCRPHVVVGTGGYVAGPVLLAAVLLGVPTVIHEQNALPGSTNRLLARWVDCVALGYKEAERYFPRRDKLVFTGNPVRPDLAALSRGEGAKRLGLRPDRPTVVIFGGSRGARSINEAVFAARERLHALSGVQFLHQTGQAGFPAVREAYRRAGVPVDRDDVIEDRNIRVVPYLYDMPAALAAADLVVSRAGALSVAEITVRGIPAILVPYPYAAGDHQTYNAKPLVDAGAARCIADAALSGATLAQHIEELIRDAAALRTMAARARELGRPAAAQDLAALIRRTARRP